MTNLGGIEVRYPDGRAARIGDLVKRPTILVIPRYYGCMPCREYLRQVADRYSEVISAGGAALGVSVGADFQAAWLVDNYKIPYPLLVDSDRNVHAAIDLPRKVSVALNPRGWVNYASAIGRGNRQGKVIDPIQTPGLALLDADAEAIWVHRGKALGDYPTLDEVLGRLSELTAPVAV